MNVSQRNRLIVRAAAMALVLTVVRAPIAKGQANAVTCADGFVATTAAICDKAHHGVATATGNKGQGMDKSVPLQGFSQPMTVPAERGSTAGNTSTTHQPNPWNAAVATEGKPVVIDPPVTNSPNSTGTGGGNASGTPASLGVTSFPPGATIPPDTTKEPRRRDP